MPLSRRSLLMTLGAGTTAAGLGWWRWRDRAPTDADALAHALTTLPTDQVALTVAGWMAAGLPAKAVLDAAFHAQMLFRCDTSDIHGALTAVAMTHLHGGDPAWHALACWSAEFTAMWLLSPAPLPAATAAEPLTAALFEGDPERIRRVALGTPPATTRATVLDHAGLRLGDPHVMIYIAQALRGLERFGPRHAAIVWASVASRLTTARPEDHARFEQITRLAGQLDLDGRRDPASAEWLRRQLAEPDLGALLGDMLRNGLSARTLTRAIIGAAIDAAGSAAHMSADGVHCFTFVDACLAAQRRTRSPLQRARLLMAAAFGLNLRRSALRAPSCMAPPPNFARHVRNTAWQHAIDPHVFKFADALLKVRQHPDRPDDFDEKACHAPFFRLGGDWLRRPTVEARLRG